MSSIYKSEEGKQKVFSTYKSILAEWPVENKQYHVSTSHGDTFIIESGNPSNPPLLLIHGSLSNSFTWFSDIPILSKDYHVFAVDIIGEAGFSAESRPTYESGAYEVWLSDVISGLGLDKCSIAGISLGGWMALRYASVFPEKVSNLILLCPGGLAKQRRGFLVRMLFKKIFSRDDGSDSVLEVLGIQEKDPEKIEKMKSALDFIILITQTEIPRYAPLPVFGEKELSKLKMPVLVVFGENDMLLNAEKSIENIKKFTPHAKALLLSGVGHAVLEQGSRIRDFLREN